MKNFKFCVDFLIFKKHKNIEGNRNKIFKFVMYFIFLTLEAGRVTVITVIGVSHGCKSCYTKYLL